MLARPGAGHHPVAPPATGLAIVLAVIESGGEQRSMRGRLTEMFVRRNGKWMHPGWHLDLRRRRRRHGDPPTTELQSGLAPRVQFFTY